MKLSVIIPTYNMASPLREGLSYLAAQAPGPDFEIVVVDDGSADDTRAVAEAFSERLPSLAYHFLPRGPRSCRSAARNVGLQAARGELVTFLDSGIALSPSFVDAVARNLEAAPRRVLLHPTHGIAPYTDTLYGSDTSPLEGLAPETFDAICARLRLRPEWEDTREGFFMMCGNRPDELEAPWTLGWSTALSLPRALALEAGGFDADFLGWGMEDAEFSYRLHQRGASFAVARDAPVIHLPHPPLSSAQEKERSHDENARRMHRKHGTRETETCLVYGGPNLNQILPQLDRLLVFGMGPRCPTDLVQELAAEHLSGPGPSLAVGVDALAEAHHLTVTHMLAHHRTLQAWLAARFPERDVRCLLGIETPFSDGFFAAAVVTDYLRMLPPLLARRVVRELARVARKAFFLGAETGEQAPQAFTLWASMTALRSLLASEGFALTERLARGHFTVYELVRAPKPSR